MIHRLIFEGPDRCGKSNISSALSRLLNIPTFKSTQEHLAFLKEQDMFVKRLVYADTTMLDFIEQTAARVILDRGWPSELVYSQYFNRTTNESALRLVDDWAARLGFIVVICRRSSYQGIKDDLRPDMNLAELDRLYVEKFVPWTRCRTLLLNVDDEDLSRELRDIVTFLKSIC